MTFYILPITITNHTLFLQGTTYKLKWWYTVTRKLSLIIKYKASTSKEVELYLSISAIGG